MAARKPKPKKKSKRRTKGNPKMDKVQYHFVIDYGWLHTHGLAEKGFPELEIRDLPNFLHEAALPILKEVA